MQFGTLLLPILGGYLFLVTCYLTRFIAVRDTGYHLFFKSAIAGSVLFATAFAVVTLTDGYRKPDTQELRLTTHYSDILNSFNDTSSSVNLSPEHFRIAIHMSEVISVRLFDPVIYNLYFSLDEMR